eukprot:gnl/Trimastix_PCT/4578.p1 GENE.gnl/Trimastix_PCT/4578~~gnl/Trimastix_PCT/4578.p1  ORF type:complete len:124 (-),score=18.47 gnl/Trimastix_PCT/4578:111-482(-)
MGVNSSRDLHIKHLPNKVFQRYRPINKLGEGGFGDTFLAEDTRAQANEDKRVVLKVIKNVGQAFAEREAIMLLHLGTQYPEYFPTLYAHGPAKIEGEERYVLVMKFFEGENLTHTRFQSEDEW